jgi:hypothetical protein
LTKKAAARYNDADMLRRLAAFLAITIGLGLAGNPVSAENAQPATPALSLAYKFAPGETIRYRISQRLTGTRTLPGATTPTPIDADLSTVIRIRCVQILSTGAAELAIDTESGSLKLAGKPASSYQPPKEVRTVYVTSTGRVAPRKEQSSQPGSRRPMLDFGAIESVVLIAILPDQPVAVGGVWDAEIPLPVDVSTKLKLSFRLDNVKQTSSGLAAEIKQSLSTPISPDSPAGPAQLRGSQEGQADLLFSIDGGKLLSAQGSIRSTVVTPIQMPGIPGSNAGPQDNLSRVALDCTFKAELLR